MHSIICIIKIIGNPIKNRGFLVLCLKAYIPNIAPMLPPISAIINNVCSLILHFPYVALRLSMYIAKKAMKFINIKYIIKYFTFY